MVAAYSASFQSGPTVSCLQVSVLCLKVSFKQPFLHFFQLLLSEWVPDECSCLAALHDLQWWLPSACFATLAAAAVMRYAVQDSLPQRPLPLMFLHPAWSCKPMQACQLAKALHLLLTTGVALSPR